MNRIFPNNRTVIKVINELREYLYPEHFRDWQQRYPDYQDLENNIKKELLEVLCVAVQKQKDCQKLTDDFFVELGNIKQKLDKDATAGYRGDPAAQSIDEVILSYPGFFAIFVHRIVNYFWKQNIPLVPRMMSEYAHSKTGIDIHPGATIGEYFFIDHGTGVVIGETTLVGNNVKIYQGVTLGALSTKGGQKLSGVKRHPTIEDNVVIYAGTTILGGATVIAKDSIIGGNAFITETPLVSELNKKEK